MPQLSRLALVMVFIVIWFTTLLYLNMSTNDGSQTQLRELEAHLKRSLENIQELKRKNLELEMKAASNSNSRASALNKIDSQMEGINSEVDRMRRELSNAKTGKQSCLSEVEKLQAVIQDLRQLEGQAQGHEFVEGGKHGLIDTPGVGPSLEHELARFKLANNIQELYYYTRAQLKKMQGVDSAQNILDDISQRHRSIQVDLMSLSNVDNNIAWREKEHAELQDLMLRRLNYLQNPKNCSSAKYLVCDLNKGCGFGCQLHHAVYCFMIAYGTQRTMILQSKGWRYAKGGWEEMFLPLSNTCTDLPRGSTKNQWTSMDRVAQQQVVSLPIVDGLSSRPPFMPLSFPEDLAPRLQRLTDDPAVWFISQFVRYLLRPQPGLKEDINKAKENLKFQNPIVGIHVRRTDKIGTEAAFHGIEEYMEHVDQWYSIQERIPGRIDKRRVYVASDDPTVLSDAKKKFPQYEFFGDTNIAKSAGLSSRYTESSLRGVILDIMFLSETDYLVCTFSSQVCRVAYEIMQTLHPDPSRWFHSLDDIYYFGGQGGHEETAIYQHYPADHNEIALEPGDVVGIAGNHWDGYSKGRNKRTGGIGLYPSYKTEDKKVIVPYPTYPEVPLTES